MATYAFDELNARFIIAEEEPEHSDLYLKIIDLDFDSGLYSVHTSEPIISLEYTVGHYYTVGAQMLKYSEETIETFIFGTRTVFNTE